MRDVEKVALERAILHQVEAGSSGLRMSGRELPLHDSPRLAEFLVGHIRNGLRDSQTRAAKWPPQVTSEDVPATCQALLDGTLDLVTASQRLAAALHTAIGDDQRIARGTLSVAIYRDATASELKAEHYVALVKLDPSDVFRPEWHTDKSGTSYLSVRELPNALPTLRERLQKCAFVRTMQSGDDYHLLVLDRQVPDISARFFMKGFLGAEVALDDKALTEGLYRAIVDARKRLQDRGLPLDRLVALDDAVQGLFAAEAIDLAEWLPALPPTERNAIDEEVRSRQLDRAFEVYPDTQKRLVTGKVRYRGDNGLRVQINRTAYKDMVHPEEIKGQTPRRFRVIIETSTWEPE
jgi:37-kD nucleoid-associated bacterial protein